MVSAASVALWDFGLAATTTIFTGAVVGSVISTFDGKNLNSDQKFEKYGIPSIIIFGVGMFMAHPNDSSSPMKLGICLTALFFATMLPHIPKPMPATIKNNVSIILAMGSGALATLAGTIYGSRSVGITLGIATTYAVSRNLL